MSYASTLAISRDRSQAQRLLGSLIGFQAVLSLATIALCLAMGDALCRRDLVRGGSSPSIV